VASKKEIEEQALTTELTGYQRELWEILAWTAGHPAGRS